MEKKKSESVRAVVEGRVTRAITKALEKLAWQVTEKHVSDNARELFGKPLKGKKEIEKCTREMSSKGKVRSTGKGKAHFTPSGEATMEVVLAPGAVGTPRGHNHGVPHVDIPRNGNRARACHCYTFLQSDNSCHSSYRSGSYVHTRRNVGVGCTFKTTESNLSGAN
jgi:hypothetical protein